MARSLERKLRFTMERRFMDDSPRYEGLARRRILMSVRDAATLLSLYGSPADAHSTPRGFLYGHLDAVLVPLLDPIHGLVRLLDEAFGRERVVGVGGDAHRRRQAGGQALLREEDVG